MIRQHTETENYEQIYKCLACGAVQEEHKLVSIKLNGGGNVYYKLRCFVCNSENIKCIGDSVGGVK